MSDREDFDRVGELLGDACEAAASPGPKASDPRGERQEPIAESGSNDSRRPPRTRRDLARAIAEAWAEVVGVEVAENATPIRLTRGNLVVSTSSSVWADTLGYMSGDLVAKLNERVGQEAVSDMVFRHAGWEERSRPRSAPSAADQTEQRQLTVEEEQAVTGIEQYDLPPALRERAARAMRRSLERGKRRPVR